MSHGDHGYSLDLIREHAPAAPPCEKAVAVAAAAIMASCYGLKTSRGREADGGLQMGNRNAASGNWPMGPSSRRLEGAKTRLLCCVLCCVCIHLRVLTEYWYCAIIYILYFFGFSRTRSAWPKNTHTHTTTRRRQSERSCSRPIFLQSSTRVCAGEAFFYLTFPEKRTSLRAVATASGSQMAAAVAASGGGGGACASAGGGPRAAYCTLITSDDFLPGLQVLVFSLRSSGTRVPLVILHTSALSDHSIAKMRKFPGCVLRAVSDIPNPNHDVHVEGWVNSGCVCASVRACASVCERVRG